MNDRRDVTALLATDVQGDFLPGGSLGVRDGDAVIEPLIEAATEAGLVVATRDWHPAGHCSFVDRGGPWPVHCVQGTPRAAVHPAIDRIAQIIVSKGTDPEREAYSTFDGTGLADMLAARGVARILIGGLATDYCVRASTIDALAAGFDVVVLRGAVRAVDVAPGDGDRALEEMRAAGAEIR